MFIGEFTHGLDAKGRVAVPAELRDVLARSYAQEPDELVITESLDGRCLWAYPKLEWQRLTEKMTEKLIGTREAIQVRRKLLAKARPVRLDGTGRVLLPESLRDYAGLVKDVVFVGAGRYVELWTPEGWQQQTAESADVNHLPWVQDV